MEKSRAIELLEHLAWDRDIERNPYGDALNIAIDALKAQLSCEGTTKDATSDTISKTETVEHLRRVLEATVPNTDYDEGFIDGIEFGISTVSTMPTIQPEERTEERTESHACDLISRQAAVELAMKYCPDDDGAVQCDGDNRGLLDELENLPPAQREPQWIPVSERVPEDLAEVITTWVNRDPLPYYEFMRDKPFTAVSVHYKGEWYWYSSTCADYLEEYGRSDRDKVDKSIEIIAWMPLPAPYQKGAKD